MASWLADILQNVVHLVSRKKLETLWGVCVASPLQGSEDLCFIPLLASHTCTPSKKAKWTCVFVSSLCLIRYIRIKSSHAPIRGCRIKLFSGETFLAFCTPSSFLRTQASCYPLAGGSYVPGNGEATQAIRSLLTWTFYAQILRRYERSSPAPTVPNVIPSASLVAPGLRPFPQQEV